MAIPAQSGLVATNSAPPTLRDYQHECLRAILNRYKAGLRRQIVCLPTGTGKTVIFAQFPAFLRMKKRMLVLAHRAELLEQARDKIMRANPSLKVEIEQAGRSASPDSAVVVASVPTLGRKGSKRLAALDPEQFYVVVVDEAHHATADSYVRILNHLGYESPDTPKLLVGFTATPKRSDGAGLDRVFDEIVFSRTLPEMIRTGYLAPVAGYRVETDIDLSGVSTRMGDFVASQLSDAVNVVDRNALVVKVFIERLAPRRTLVFCVDVAHAKDQAEAFRANGVAAGCITGDTDPVQRADTLAAFAAGDIDVLTNCMVLTEGYDEPSVEGIILARPTKSTLLYTQMIGRGTRLHPGKENVTIIDIVDNSRRHSLVTLPTLFGLTPHFDLKGKTTDYIERALRWVEHERPWVRTDQVTDLDELRYRCTHVELVNLEVPEELHGCARFAWTQIAPRTYRLGLGNGESLTVASTLLGRWEAVLSSPESHEDDVIVSATDDCAATVRKAEAFVRQARPGSIGLVDTTAYWRYGTPSERQLTRIRKAGLVVPEHINRGQASHLLAMLFARRQGRAGIHNATK
jgi:ATP-dependent helicase IRC3